MIWAARQIFGLSGPGTGDASTKALRSKQAEGVKRTERRPWLESKWGSEREGRLCRLPAQGKDSAFSERVRWKLWRVLSSSTIASDRCLKMVAYEIHVEDIVLSEISQAQKDKYYMLSLIRGSQQSQTQRSREWNGYQDWEEKEMGRY